MVTALALAGDLRFNPLEDTLTDANGNFCTFVHAVHMVLLSIMLISFMC